MKRKNFDLKIFGNYRKVWIILSKILTPDAYFLLSYLHNKASGWQLNKKDLMRSIGCADKKLNRIFKELETFKILIRPKQQKDYFGKWCGQYYIFILNEAKLLELLPLSKNDQAASGQNITPENIVITEIETDKPLGQKGHLPLVQNDQAALNKNECLEILPDNDLKPISPLGLFDQAASGQEIIAETIVKTEIETDKPLGQNDQALIIEYINKKTTNRGEHEDEKQENILTADPVVVGLLNKLKSFKIEEKVALSYLETYGQERVSEVLENVNLNARNIPSWINSAFTSKWRFTKINNEAEPANYKKNLPETNLTLDANSIKLKENFKNLCGKLSGLSISETKKIAEIVLFTFKKIDALNCISTKKLIWPEIPILVNAFKEFDTEWIKNIIQEVLAKYPKNSTKKITPENIELFLNYLSKDIVFFNNAALDAEVSNVYQEVLNAKNAYEYLEKSIEYFNGSIKQIKNIRSLS